jgi:hypothetical protein
VAARYGLLPWATSASPVRTEDGKVRSVEAGDRS